MGEFGKSGGGQLPRPLGEELQRETDRDLQGLEEKSERVHEAQETRGRKRWWMATDPRDQRLGLLLSARVYMRGTPG
ncbi:MAG: hypothetical protein ACT4PO_03890 [Actinomycetota bacterium]